MLIVNMVMAFCALVLLVVCAIQPPHRIFQEAPPVPAVEVPDLEAANEEEEEEDREERKKRFIKIGAEDCSNKFSGKGNDFSARDKKILLHIFDNCEKYWHRDNCKHYHDQRVSSQVIHYRIRPSVNKFFEEITGVGHTTLNRLKTERDTDDEINGPEGFVMPSNRTGAKRTVVNKNALEVILPEMDQFIRDEIEKARKGGYLTVKKLAESATAYFNCGGPIKPQRMKRCLKRLGYEYKQREGKFVNRRSDPESLKKLKEFCEWVMANVTYIPETGLYTFTVPVGFGDGANEYTKAFRGRSWVLRSDPKLRTCEKSRSKDSGQRLNMLGAVYSSSYDMQSFETWSSTDKTKNKYAKSDDIVHHTVAHVLPNLPGGTGAVYVLDNASNNKKIDEELADAKADRVHDWIIKHDPDPERFNEFWKKESEDKTEKQEKKALLKYIRTNIDEFTELAQLLREADVALRYLPPYYPECNPIELIWAHIKREFKATDVNKPWKERMEIAHSKVTELQIEQSFDRSIRYCLDRLEELRATEAVHGGEARDDQVVYDDEESDGEQEWLNDQ